MHAVLEVGGTHVIAAVVDPVRQEVLLAKRRDLDSSAGAAQILATLAGAIEALGPRARGIPLAVALPGPFDYDRGIGDFDGVAKFGSLKGVDVREALGKRLGTIVCFVNDVTAYAIGQYELLGRPARMIALTLGTGVGSCFLQDGIPVDEGLAVPPHGWVHLLRYHGRPIEESFSRRAIVTKYHGLTGRLLDVLDIATLARGGDSTAELVVHDAFTALAETLGPWVRRFDAELVVIGGSITKSWDLVERWFIPLLLHESRASTIPDARIVEGASDDTAALIGAALHCNAR